MFKAQQGHSLANLYIAKASWKLEWTVPHFIARKKSFLIFNIQTYTQEWYQSLESNYKSKKKQQI